MIVINKTSNRNAALNTELLRGVTFNRENMGHKFVISCMRGGVLEPVSGTVTGYFMRSNNTTCRVEGTGFTGVDTDGRAWIILPQDCYNVAGRFKLSIYVLHDGASECIYSCIGTVERSDVGEVIDSGVPLPTYDDIADKYNEMETARQACIDAAESVSGAVRYDTTQSLTDAQKTQGRTNIGAASVGEIDDLKSDFNLIGTSAEENTPAHWVSGGLTTSMTGTNTNTNLARIAGAWLERLPDDGVVSVEIPSTLLCRVAVYSERNFLRVVSRITGYSGAENTRTNGSVKIPSEYNGLYLGMDCKKVDGTDFTAEEITALSSQIVVKTTTLIGDLSDLDTNDKSSIVSAINENKDAIDEINDDIYDSSNAEYSTSNTYPLGFVKGYFSSSGISKTINDYSRNVTGIRIDENCKSIRIVPKDGVTLNYCIFSEEPIFTADADNSSILLANGGGFNASERIIDDPPTGLLYVSHKISRDNLVAGERPVIVLSGIRFSDAKEYNTLGYTRDYTDVTWQLNFERKQISVNGIEDSMTHVIAKLPNIGCIEVRMNTPAGKFAVFKDTNGTITKLCDYTTYQYRIFADYVSDYYIDITNISVTTLTIANARRYVLAYLYSDTGEYRKTEYMNKLSGMNIAFIGDSITQGRFHKTGTDEDTDGTNYTMSKPYPVLVAEICGDRNVMNYGIGGALVYDSDWKSLYRNCGNVAGFDYVFVHAGTNDYGGNISSEAFTSAYNYVISTLKANNTNVVVLTPVARTNRTSKNTENLYLKDYANIEKTIAEQQSCSVIDLLTLTNNSTFKSLLSDGLHPDEIGHAYIADLILKGM